VSVQLRWEQCCATQDCTRPARYGDLCTTCYLAATPQRRAVALGGPGLAAAKHAPDVAAYATDVVDPAGAAWLSALWAA
jgi:hypothetical protein